MPELDNEVLDEEGHPEPHFPDSAVRRLADADGAIGDFVSRYLEATADGEDRCVEEWFAERARAYYYGCLSEDNRVLDLTAHVDTQSGAVNGKRIELVSVFPHYFRGFKSPELPIVFDGDLVVVDGKNSSGKTSLGEAIEWLITGKLSRREGGDAGSAPELSDCISNVFRPPTEKTFVRGTFLCPSNGQIVLQRNLVADYGATITSECESRLSVNGQEIAKDQELRELAKLFGAEAPILMQHTLRDFVQSNPNKRREYFEQLLRLNHITDLIGKAFASKESVDGLECPNGNEPREALSTLVQQLNNEGSESALAKPRQLTVADYRPVIRRSLLTVAEKELDESFESFGDAQTRIEKAQELAKQRSFPPLAELKPRRETALEPPGTSYRARCECAQNAYLLAKTHYLQGAHSEKVRIRAAIYRALDLFVETGLIDSSATHQFCPFCGFENAPTLFKSRIEEISAWSRLLEQRGQFDRARNAKLQDVSRVLADALHDYQSFLPEIPAPNVLSQHLEGANGSLVESVDNLVAVRDESSTALESAICKARSLNSKFTEAINTLEFVDGLFDEVTELCAELDAIHAHGVRYLCAFNEVETKVGASVRTDPLFRFREAWLTCATDVEGINAEFKWVRAKRDADKDLKLMRNHLISYREDLLNARRNEFNQGIDGVWSALRKDSYSRFSQLHIPKPRGRGYPVRIELKAMLSDAQGATEVDVLKVFSESQVNALGISAFITRSKLLGHGVLIFDDPVQSMDEDHFKTFARDVLTLVLSEGFQVILLTHNDTFARDVSYWHYDRCGYKTMSVRHSRREGCVVEEGNRRVAERLKRAEKCAEEGKLGDAWRYIRRAVERLYLVSVHKYSGGEFDPTKWAHQTAEYMWNEGAKSVFDTHAPGSSQRLKEILDMSSSASHDAYTSGVTDVVDSCRFLREMLRKMRVGG